LALFEIWVEAESLLKELLSHDFVSSVNQYFSSPTKNLRIIRNSILEFLDFCGIFVGLIKLK